MMRLRVHVCFALLALSASAAGAQQRLPISGNRTPRLAIRNATIVDGNGTPASGPADILVEGSRITSVTFLDPVAIKSGTAKRPAADAEIDATGKYVLPGLINAHAHLQDERAHVAQPYEYTLKLWLASGITSVREVGADTTEKVIAIRDRGARGEIASPRIFVYGRFSNQPVPTNPDAARVRVRALKTVGADGFKILGIDRDIMAAMLDEAHKVGLRDAHHAGVEETNALDDARFGTTSIEHLGTVFPMRRFPTAVSTSPPTTTIATRPIAFVGRVACGVKPIPYCSARCSKRWSRRRWRGFRRSTFMRRRATCSVHRRSPGSMTTSHPTLEDYFRPDPANHGSYFFGWSSTDETYWKENYRIWMSALRDFERKGGLIGAGDDAGFIYQMYGFGLIRELELQQEAGFQPLKVIQHATGNNARILGREADLGRVRPGYLADLIVVNGNPLENLKVLYPTGVDEMRDGKVVRGGGVEWTIKDGIPYHAPTLLADVKKMVAKARAERVRP